MAFKEAMALAQLQKDTRQVVVIDDKKILFIWHKDHVHAIQSQCPHLKMSLAKGTITEKDSIICPFHKSEFDLCTGETQCWSPWPPIVGSLLGKLSKEKNLQVYATRVEDGKILVDVN